MRVLKGIGITLGVLAVIALVVWTIVSIYGACVDQTPIEVFKDLFGLVEQAETVVPPAEESGEIAEAVSFLVG
ncbi:MAG: hypothetical protein IJB98_03610 [Clostridia bacterium]|nr:hypothetical protein [Clostridia bacterium]